MNVPARFFARDPFGVARARRDLAIETHSEFGGDERDSRHRLLRKGLDYLAGLVFALADMGLDSLIIQAGYSAARDVGVWVCSSDVNFDDSGVYDGLRAWGRSAEVIARLKCDVERRS